MCKLFHIGIEGQCWNLTDSIHSNAETVVMWGGQLSDSFEIHQCVKQGGILSIDMYKVYNNKLIDRFGSVMLGIRIRGISCVAPTCADDKTLARVVVPCKHSSVYQWTTVLWSTTCSIQLVRSVVLIIPASRSKDKSEDAYQWTLKDEPTPNVSETMHMGIMGPQL